MAQAPFPLIRPIQPSFASGELSASLYSRVDIEKYKTGLRTCRNFIIHPNGGASNRGGFKFIALTKYANRKARVVRFIFNQEQAYVFEIGHFYIRFYTNQLPIQANTPAAWSNVTTYNLGDYVTFGGGTYYCLATNTNQQPDISPTYWVAQTVYEIPTPYSETDLPKLRFESSADVTYITSPDFQTRTLSRFGNADWRMALYSADDGPFQIQNLTDTTMEISAVSGTGLTMTASANYFDPLMVGTLFSLQHYVSGQVISPSFTGTGASANISCFTTWRVISHGTWSGAFNIEKSTDGGTTWTVLRSFSSVNDFNADTFGTEDIASNPVPFLVRVNFTSFSSGTANITFSTDPFFQIGIARVTSYTDATHVTVDVLQALGSTGTTKTWAEGSWSNFRGWPSVARFFQDRLCFASTYAEPETTWMTVTGDYTSFIRHTILLDTDGITVPLPTRQLNAINGLIALRKLLAFTSATEWTIGPPQGNVLTPNTVEQLVQGYRGSFGTDPVMVGFEAIFVQAASKVVRNLQYQLYFDLYTGSELTILSRHLFEKNTIIEMAYQQDPDSIVYFCRDDGILVGMTYMAEQEVIAWHRHDTGGGANVQGYFESICTIPGNGYDELWAEIKRGDYRFIELQSQRIVTSTCADESTHQRVQDSFFVDCGVTFGETPIRITSISNGNPQTVTAPAHGLSNGATIKLLNLIESIQLNGTTWTIGNVTTNTFDLITEL